MVDDRGIRQRYQAQAFLLNERTRRLFAAAEAEAAGRGGIAAVSRATGIARSTIGRGVAELRADKTLAADRIRRPGGGRKPNTAKDPDLVADLQGLVASDTRGDPQSPLLWTSKSLSKLSRALSDMGHTAGRSLVGELLHEMGYRLQANQKTREGTAHPDRDAQFQYINTRVTAA